MVTAAGMKKSPEVQQPRETRGRAQDAFVGKLLAGSDTASMFFFNKFLATFATFTAVVHATSFKPDSLDDLQSAVDECVKESPPAPGQVHVVHSEEDLKKLQSTGQLVVTDWFATWCGPCINFKPTFKEMAQEYDDVLFCQIDVDECQNLSQEHGISSMPTFKASCRSHSQKQLVVYATV